MALSVGLKLLTACGIVAQIYDVLRKDGSSSAIANANVPTNANLDVFIQDSGARRDALTLMDTVLRTTIATIFGSKATDELERMNINLGEIKDVLTAQASFGDSFPQHVYDFAMAEIDRYETQGDQNPHYFFIYSQATDWHAKFHKIFTSNPLGPQFCGYYSDLDVLSALMVRVFRPVLGPNAHFHILMPSVLLMVMPEPLIFPKEVGHFSITGERNAYGTPYIWVNLYRTSTSYPYLNDVGNLPEPKTWRGPAAVATLCGMSCAGSGLGILATSVLVPFTGPIGLLAFASLGFGGLYGGGHLLCDVANSEYWNVKPRMLGAKFLGVE